MKINKLIGVLLDAVGEFGDVDIKLMDSHSGDWVDIRCVLKLHPYTAKYRCMNRDEEVDSIALCANGGNALDLILFEDKP
jgi:hypothetical protein